MSIDRLLADLDAHQDANLDVLTTLLRMPSISTDSARKGDVRAVAEYLKGYLGSMGLEHVTIHETAGHPIVTADHLHAPGKPTVLIYGHYDVQPSDPEGEWKTPPFEPVIRDGRIYARGASDDKGQFLTHLCALGGFHRTGTPLPVNIKILLEGEEEIGSPNLVPFLEAHCEWAACDLVLVSDTSMYDEDQPSITVGLRGLAYMEVLVKSPDRDLHSGVFGGAVPNPANVLAEIIAGLRSPEGKVLIPGFYDDVLELTPEEKAAVDALPFDAEQYKADIGIKGFTGEQDYSVLERVSSRPTLDVNGLWSGYQGEGAKTVLPARAGAKVSMRLVPNQDPHRIAALFKEHVMRIAPPTVEVEVRDHHGGWPIVVDLDFEGLQAAAEAFRQVYGKEVLFTREGGSIPIIADFKRVLGANSVLMGFGLTKDALHSPNESFSLKDFHRGAKVSATFLSLLGA
jgi:acetylornithine deacetylase/succinyl-diaminopimelate desuccinylase-like protein